MKTFSTGKIIVILTMLITACRAQEAEPFQTESGAITCEVYYRPSAGDALEPAPALTFMGGDERQLYDFENMAFEAKFQDDAFEGRALSIVVTNLDTRDEISRQLYQFDPQNPLKNQFVGGHGFTGLNYVFHPTSSAEMQYFCSLK